MTGPSEDPERADKASVDSVLEEFDSKKDMLATLCAKTKSLVEECLDDANIRYQSVQARVKTRKKLREKYNSPERNYRRLSDITDLAGLRIITYYEDEVDLVAEVIRREFEIDSENSVDKRSEAPPDRFSYHAVNIVCRHSPQRLASVEYKRFTGVSCEIQITSILRHAWAEIEHDWYDLKDNFPAEIKRRFYRMAALLEVAESEFLELRNKKTQYQRSVAVQIEANVSGIELNAVSLGSFLEQEPLVASINTAIASVSGTIGFGTSARVTDIASKLANRAGLKTIEDLRSSLKIHEKALIEFSELSRPYRVIKVGAPLATAACVNRLALMLISKEGEEKLSEAIRDFGVTGITNATELSKISRMVMSKYFS